MPDEIKPTEGLSSSELYRPLYDVTEGGKPRGYACKLTIHDCDEAECAELPCPKVTRTLRGMLMHLDRKHGVKPQLEIKFDGDTKAEAGRTGSPDATPANR